ncbi:hypothetical protein [Cylindrospermum sp. FACHB-282]|uniref:hypothetical protein n=1 Tax=Cylindrospermum sp. FACHB-282 TaxID=2692794 RepID=UPI0016884D92|nr:hypothetical protein [Cylindrospermum sp. FACHB-282]MBD2385307.1 hypothetical protein [Cylindrospermum sp. FACHB-282]
MKVDFSNGQAQVINYSDSKKEIDGNIYLDESVLDRLREWKWLEENILEQLEFKIFKISNKHCSSYQWLIATPPRATKHLSTIAEWRPDIKGEISIKEFDGQNNYICKY